MRLVVTLTRHGLHLDWERTPNDGDPESERETQLDTLVEHGPDDADHMARRIGFIHPDDAKEWT